MNEMNKISIYSLICIIVGASVIIYTIYDYEYRVFAYRYLPSLCPTGSGCPYPALDDNLVLLGAVIIVIGIVLVLVRKFKRLKIRKSQFQLEFEKMVSWT